MRYTLAQFLFHSTNILKLLSYKSSFDEQIFKWATEFGFKVDEEYIFINKGELPEFIKELDEKFEEWQDLKKKKNV